MKWILRLIEEAIHLLSANYAERNPEFSWGRPQCRGIGYASATTVLALSLTVLLGSQLLLPPRLVFAAPPEPLHLEVFTGDESSWGVTSTLIYGKTEAVLVDGQFHTSQAGKLAERIAAVGRRLNAIIITHPDDDHYLGMAVLHERFPDAKIYMTAAALEEFKRTAEQELARQKKNTPAEMSESLPTPEVLPTTLFLVDGQAIQVIKDFQGDVKKPMNTFIWVPSLEAVITGDIVFDGIHPWLADSDEQTRNAWLHSLEFIASLHPRIVVPGHKGDQNLPNSAETVASMRRYLSDFEAARKAAVNADGLVAAMKQKYPNLKVEKFLVLAAKAAFPAAPTSGTSNATLNFLPLDGHLGRASQDVGGIMRLKRVDRENAQHYTWGDGCDGWHLVQNSDLSVIEEQMPPGTSEVQHYHRKAQQFFFVLSGQASMEADGEEMNLSAAQGVSILPGAHHRFHNDSKNSVTFLVISQPPSHGDRVTE